ncbi:MAG TPA: TIGR02680 family protein [Streptosporangiaceae bacterium]
MNRFQPTRAGIINMWDYRDEEFCFADGWLILRGPNGSGKTKALEVLFPFVLDGRIDSKRLNPFAAEDRTMKSNLLFRGGENAVGYVWLELRHRDTGEAVTIGVGLHAARHRDTPVRWHFVADGRVGADFSLITGDDRPMTRKQLAEEIGEPSLHTSSTDYRAAVDQRLFGLGKERYEQLLTLILTLRRPQLAKNLDPVKLSDTLTDGLRPVDDDLIAEAARSFDDMEAVATTLEGLTAADEATRAFLASYTTYLRTHARSAADALTRRRAASTQRRAELAGDITALTSAEAGQAEAQARREEAENSLAGLRARYDQLKSSSAYQAVEQLADLERLVRTNEQTAAEATAELTRRRAATARARADTEQAAAILADCAAVVSRTAAELADHAAEAGIGWQPADVEAGGFTERAGARVTARLEAVRAVRAALESHRRAEHARDLARLTLDRALEAVTAAGQAQQAAADAVAGARADAQTALARWAADHADVLGETAMRELAEGLSVAIEVFGDSDAATLESVFTSATADAEQAVRDEQARLRAEITSTQERRGQIAGEREQIAAQRDDAPPAHPGRTAGRSGRHGAPLWRLVRFAGGIGETQAAAIEAALEATGMLDAWITPDSHDPAAGDSDGYLVPGAPAKGPSLADVLEAEDDTPVPAARIGAVLASIGRGSELFSCAAVIGADGRYSHGVTAGAHHKDHAEYIGATARARRRAARIAECEARIAELDELLATAGRRAAGLAGTLAAFAQARAALPRTTAIGAALRAHSQAVGELRSASAGADSAQSGYDESVAACTVTERSLRRTAIDHGIEWNQADLVEAAARRFEATAADLTGRRREQTQQRGAATAARERLDQATDEERACAETELAARRRHTEEAAKLAALRGTVGKQAQEVMAQIEEAERGIATAQSAGHSARNAEIEAIKAVSAVAERIASGRRALDVALEEERATARGLAPFAARELLDVLKCPPGLAWPAQEADWAGDGLLQSVIDVHEAICEVTRDLTPTETSLKISTTRLTRALEDLQTQLAAAGQDYHPEWDSADGIIVVRIADEQGLLPVGAFSERIAAARRDQQLLLTESEQRILEDALLARLAQQIHERTVDARDLISQMNTEMRSRKMSSGKTVGVRWLLADGLDDEQRAVCGLLDADASRLNPDSLARMRGHFAAQIKTARARHRDLPYRELLAQVLDYRRWRQFVFQMVSPEGGEEKLTRARHSRLSGGEQSVSLHLPLFAAAHAMLNSAHPHAPRLLALDEAFAGVDDTGRGELMGLAAQFDLDLFMTGYDLWATQAAVRAAAHYDLAHSPIEHTVSALLLVWDGARLLADEVGELSAALGSPGTRRTITAAA